MHLSKHFLAKRTNCSFALCTKRKYCYHNKRILKEVGEADMSCKCCSWLGIPPVIYYVDKNYDYSVKGYYFTGWVYMFILALFFWNPPSNDHPSPGDTYRQPLFLYGLGGLLRKMAHQSRRRTSFLNRPLLLYNSLYITIIMIEKMCQIEFNSLFHYFFEIQFSLEVLYE